MNKRILGKTGWSISEVGFGGWGIGKTWWGTTDDEASIKALQTAWDNSINFFDTAFIYGDGHSEELMGRVLAGKPVHIATKIPPKTQEWPPSKNSRASATFPSDWIISCTERSLKKLRQDSLDLTQFHVWRDEWMIEDEWKEAVATLKRQGKIRAFGVSINDHEPNSALKLVASGLIDTVQVIFNIFDQTPLEALLPLCQKNNVGVIVRVPFDEGGLTGTFEANTKFEEGDFRRSYFQGTNLKETVERVDKLKQFVGNGVKSMPALALKFILAHDAVSVVIPGMRKASHVLENVKSVEGDALKKETVKALVAHAWPRNFYGWWD